MTTFRQYKQRPKAFAAVQYVHTPEGLALLDEFLKVHGERYFWESNLTTIRLDDAEGKRCVNPGDWLVVYAGALDILCDRVFTNRFEPYETRSQND